MAARPLVSIVTPSYNQAAYLEQTIQSVINQPSQGDAFDLEYILIDGGSRDGSQAIIQKYESSLAWWISEEDHGQAEAINKGFRQARGEILAWLNSDDLYLPGAIAQAVKIFEQDPSVGMVYGDALAIDENGEAIKRWTFGNWGLREFLRFRIICQPAVFLRRSIVDVVGYLDESYHYLLDHQLWIRVAAQSQPRHVPSLWAAARQHPQAKNVASATRFSEEIQRVYEWALTQPNLAPKIAADRRKVLGGMHRLRARYYLDGGNPRLALLEYGKALTNDPVYALKHWQRIIYAIFYWVGGEKVRDVSKKMRVEWRKRFQRTLSNLPRKQTRINS
jgi:glycosyltransferase involved in cell wall biosynthesis